MRYEGNSVLEALFSEAERSIILVVRSPMMNRFAGISITVGTSH
jgi:hypothetical protein